MICKYCKHFIGYSEEELCCRVKHELCYEDTEACDDFLWNVGKEQLTIFPSDNVNHPDHYETGKFECIDVMIETQGVEAVKNFCLCNAFKYIWRTNRKNGLEDVKKAHWYLNKYLELEEQQCTDTPTEGR